VSTVAALFRAAVGSIRVGYLENFVSRCDLSLLDDALPVQSCRAAGTISQHIGRGRRSPALDHCTSRGPHTPGLGLGTSVVRA
jgi:hypothetical protein